MTKNMRNINRFFAITLIVVGVVSIVLSSIYMSSYLAILGASFLFWGGILLYIKPTKQVPITFLTALNLANMSNIERILSELKFTEKGIYLPPRYLQSIDSSLIFIPKSANQCLPKPKETKMTELLSNENNALFLTPSGYALSQLYEQELSTSFSAMELPNLKTSLRKVLVDRLEMAENVEVELQDNILCIDISGCLFKSDSQEILKFPQANGTVGSVLSSSLACALAKITGKPVIINAEKSLNDKIMRIEYKIVEK